MVRGGCSALAGRVGGGGAKHVHAGHSQVGAGGEDPLQPVGHGLGTGVWEADFVVSGFEEARFRFQALFEKGRGSGEQPSGDTERLGSLSLADDQCDRDASEERHGRRL